LADLTLGYGHERDVVSLSQIAELAGGLRRPNVRRALKALERLGLCGQSPAKGQSADQQSKDEQACYSWAQQQSGINLATGQASTEALLARIAHRGKPYEREIGRTHRGEQEEDGLPVSG
jgi:hypothetical protein